MGHMVSKFSVTETGFLLQVGPDNADQGPRKSAVAEWKGGHSKEEGRHVPGMTSPFTGSCTPPQACRLGSWIPDGVEASAPGAEGSPWA